MNQVVGFSCEKDNLENASETVMPVNPVVENLDTVMIQAEMQKNIEIDVVNDDVAKIQKVISFTNKFCLQCVRHKFST